MVDNGIFAQYNSWFVDVVPKQAYEKSMPSSSGFSVPYLGHGN